MSVGGQLRFFGDTFQISKLIGGRRYWRIPVMEGEFLVEEKFGVQRAVAGGNILILGSSATVALEAAELAVEAMRRTPGIILPFPGGIVRSGSKVGSRYKFLKASTNDPFCPSLRGLVSSSLPEEVNSVYEIVIDGLDIAAVEQATRVGIYGGLHSRCPPDRGRKLRRESGKIQNTPAQSSGGGHSGMTTLTLKLQPEAPLEAEAITPDNFLGKSTAAIAGLPVMHGNEPALLGDFFQVDGDGSEEIVLVGDLSRVKSIAAGMTRGRVDYTRRCGHAPGGRNARRRDQGLWQCGRLGRR